MRDSLCYIDLRGVSVLISGTQYTDGSKMRRKGHVGTHTRQIIILLR